MSRRKPYVPKSFESVKGSGDTSANIYKTMQNHAAWKCLSPTQKVLYLACKAERYGKKKHDLDSFGQQYRTDPTVFTFNRSKWKKGIEGSYDLYSNQNQFYKDMDSLIKHGFIDCVICGKSTRTKSLYRFSSRWQFWGTDQFSLPASVMTDSLLHKQAPII